MTEDVLPDLPYGDTDGAADRPVCRPALYEAVAQGARELHRAFREAPPQFVPAGTMLVAPGQPSKAIYALSRGWACRIREHGDGRRSIPEIHVAGDLVGLEAALWARPTDAVVTLQTLAVRALDADMVAGLLARKSTASYLAWVLSEAQRRAERRADRLALMEAKERLASMLVELHERLRRRELVTAGSFNLPLTQQQIGDHLGLTVVHVNRTLRELREARIVIVDRHVVMIRDMARLRWLASSDRAGSDATTPDTVIERLRRSPQPAGDRKFGAEE